MSLHTSDYHEIHPIQNDMQGSDKTTRPKDLKTVLVKSMISKARDCPVEWKADFARMEMLLYVPFISPALLLDFIWKLPGMDERFQKTGIVDPVHICSRFSVKLCVAHGDCDAWYKLWVYKMWSVDNKIVQLGQWDIELTALPG